MLGEACRQASLPSAIMFFGLHPLHALRGDLGIRLGNYIMALKIEKAQELLYSTDMSVSEIASAVGIPDFNYFSRVFKKKVGSTPMAFRKSNNGELALQLSKYELQNELMKDFERLSNAPSPQPLDGTEETR